MRTYCHGCDGFIEPLFFGSDTDYDDDNRLCIVDIYECPNCEGRFYIYPCNADFVEKENKRAKK